MTRMGDHLRSNAVAYLALFVALGGTSYAATSLPAHSVGSKQLRANAVSSGKVRDHSLKAADFAHHQLPRGPRGPRGKVGPQGPGMSVFSADPTASATDASTHLADAGAEKIERDCTVDGSGHVTATISMHGPAAVIDGFEVTPASAGSSSYTYPGGTNLTVALAVSSAADAITDDWNTLVVTANGSASQIQGFAKSDEYDNPPSCHFVVTVTPLQ